MNKIGICGHFGKNKSLLNGQTIKTKVLTEELEKVLGIGSVITVDTHGWIKKPLSLLAKCFQITEKCNDIIILPAQNGVKIFVPLFVVINKLFHKKLHYVVIGGWLPELLAKNKKLRSWVSKFNTVYVETLSMLETLEKQGLQNVKYLPNFKRLNVLDEHGLVYSSSSPYKLCTFSRVSKEKGIEDAIKSVKYVNETLGFEAFSLDIYGQIDEQYRETFLELKKSFPNYISYKGLVDYSSSVKVLKEYYALLFPTYYKGEGFAGTILDAYSAGLPVIATNWKYNPEIIQDKYDGLLYDYNNPEGLQEILIDLVKDPNEINNMKINCLKRANDYLPETVIKKLLNNLGTK